MAVAAVVDFAQQQVPAIAACQRPPQIVAVGIIFHHQQGIEQRRRAGQALDFRQPQAVMFKQLDMALLHGRQLLP